MTFLQLGESLLASRSVSDNRIGAARHSRFAGDPNLRELLEGFLVTAVFLVIGGVALYLRAHFGLFQ